MVRSKTASYVLLLAFGFRLCVPLWHSHAAVTDPCVGFAHPGDEHGVFLAACPEDCQDPHHHHRAPHNPDTCVICKLTECSSHYVASAAIGVPGVEVCGVSVYAALSARHDVSPHATSIRGPPLPPTTSA